jgi:hypothetical protein
MIIYTNQRSKKKKQQPSQKLLAAQAAHRKFLASMRISPVKRGTKLRGLSSNFSDLSVTSNVAPLSNTIPGSGAKKSLDDYKWKKDQQESAEAIAEAEKKKTRIAPYTNKGAYMYVTDDADAKTLGRKV